MSVYKENNLIITLTLEFALEIMKYCDELESSRKYNMARQLWRSGTAIGALANEAQNAESKLDFIHKMKIAAKEGDETEYWLRLCKNSLNYPPVNELQLKLESINKIINKIISTSKNKNNLKIS